MKHSLQVSEDGSLFTITTEGDGDVEGTLALLRELIAHPLWRPGNHVLLDHRGLRMDRISGNDINDISGHFRSFSARLGNGKIALVMNRDIDYGIARAWEILTEGEIQMTIHVFRKMDKATAWLQM